MITPLAACSNSSTLDQAEREQQDWEQQVGDAWDTYVAAFGAASVLGCESVFADSPDGQMYVDDVAYDSSDCVELDPASVELDGRSAFPTEVPEDPEGPAEEYGTAAGCNSFFDEASVEAVFYGDDDVVFSRDDCPSVPL